MIWEKINISGFIFLAAKWEGNNSAYILVLFWGSVMGLEICLAGICHCYGDVLEKGSNFSNGFSKQWSCLVVFIIPRNLMTDCPVFIIYVIILTSSWFLSPTVCPRCILEIPMSPPTLQNNSNWNTSCYISSQALCSTSNDCHYSGPKSSRKPYLTTLFIEASLFPHLTAANHSLP